MRKNRTNIFNTIPSNVKRWTYRYEKNGYNLERHSDTLIDLVTIAVDDLEQNRAIPLSIRADSVEIMNTQDIALAWSDKYLEGRKLSY